MRKQLKEFYDRYESHLAVGALVFGFIFDSFTLNRPDQLLDNAILLTYLIISGTVIGIMVIRSARGRTSGSLTRYLPLLLQFSFGNLTSGLLVLYFRSGTITQSFLFFLILVALLVGNEFLKSRYAQFRFNIALYYLLLLCYVQLTVPIVLHAIGPWIFVISTLVSLAFIAGYIWVLGRVARKELVQHRAAAGGIIGTIALCFSILYFLNIIPPVPLAMRDLGIYHSVLKRSDNSYLALYEPAAWHELLRDTAYRYTIPTGESATASAVCFSSVFAPAELRTPIYHSWEFYNTERGEWETRSRVSFPIAGGRSEGYRGWSIKTVLSPGKWRCNVETAQGSLIGRKTFEVVEGVVPELSQRTL